MMLHAMSGFVSDIRHQRKEASLSANIIMAKLTSHFQRTRLKTSSIAKHYLLDSEDDSVPLRLSKRQSPTPALFRTTLTRTITQDKLLFNPFTMKQK